MNCNFILEDHFTQMGQTVAWFVSILQSCRDLTIRKLQIILKNIQLLLHINIASSSLDKILLRERAELLKACFSYISHGHASNTHITVPSNFKSPTWKYLQVQQGFTASVLLFWCFNFVTSYSRMKFDISTEPRKSSL